MLKVGDELPNIETFDHNGNKVNLRSFIGKPLVLYFYPMDDTSGCTAEACSFRDNIEKFKNVNIVGVSVQDEKSHRRFMEKYKINFTLIADKDKSVCKAFGTLNFTGLAKRVTFIFDEKGICKYVFEKVDAKNHAEEVYQKLKELNLVK